MVGKQFMDQWRRSCNMAIKLDFRSVGNLAEDVSADSKQKCCWATVLQVKKLFLCKRMILMATKHATTSLSDVTSHQSQPDLGNSAVDVLVFVVTGTILTKVGDFFSTDAFFRMGSKADAPCDADEVASTSRKSTSPKFPRNSFPSVSK